MTTKEKVRYHHHIQIKESLSMMMNVEENEIKI